MAIKQESIKNDQSNKTEKLRSMVNRQRLQEIQAKEEMHKALAGGGDYRKYYGSPEPNRSSAHQFRAFSNKRSLNAGSLLLPPLIKQLNNSISHGKNSVIGARTLSVSHRSEQPTSIKASSTRSPRAVEEDIMKKLELMKNRAVERLEREHGGGDPRLKH